MRRQQKYRQPQLVAYLQAEIANLKAILGHLTDGRVVVYGSGAGPGGSGSGGGSAPPAAEHVLYGSKHTKSLSVTAGVGLNAAFEEGHVRIDEAYTLIAAGSIALADASANYVFVNNAGAVAANTTGFPANCVPLAEVATAGGAITTVTDKRAYLWGHHGPRFVGAVIIGADDTPTAGFVLDVRGNTLLGAYYADISQIATPANPAAGTRRLFVDNADGKLKVRTSAGTSVSLEEQGGAGAPHDLLSVTHTDTLAAAVVRGGLVYGNATPKWAQLAVGANGSLLTSNGTDVAWDTSPYIAGHVGIGATVDVFGSAMLTIAPDATTARGLLIWGIAAQTADYIRVLDSAGNLQLTLSPDGTSCHLMVPRGDITTGQADARIGIFTAYGDATLGTSGGLLQLELAADYDAAFELWGIQPYEDDLRFSAAGLRATLTAEGQLQLPVTGSTGGVLVGGDVQLYRVAAGQLLLDGTGDDVLWVGDVNYGLNLAGGNPQSVVDSNDYWLYTRATNALEFLIGGAVQFGFASNLAYYPRGYMSVGTDDTLRGDLTLYGFAAGAQQGGVLRLFLSADYDAVFQHWAVDAFEDDLRFSSSDGATVNLMTAEGMLTLPRTGATAGLLIGGDANLYRMAANVLRTDDGLTAVGHLAVGGNMTTVDANNVSYLDETFSGALGATARRGFYTHVTFDPNAATTGFHSGFRVDVDVGVANAQDFDWLVGGHIITRVRGTGAKDHVIGLKVDCFAYENNAVATDVLYLSVGGETEAVAGSSAVGLWGLEINNLGLGWDAISSECVAIEILPQTAKGASSAYGIQIGDITGATTVIPIYQAGATGHNRIVAPTIIGADETPGSYTLTVKSAISTLLLESSSATAAGARLDFKQLSATPADFDAIARTSFYGYNDAVVPETIEYGNCILYAADVSDGTEDGRMEWKLMSAGALTVEMTLHEAGQLRLPVTGSSAGLLVGADTLLYRGAADVWYSPDSLRLDGHMRVGSTAAPTNVTAGDLTVVRLFVGDAAAVAGKEALITGDMAITGTLVIGTAPDYTVTNVTTDRTYDANATTLDEIADILGTLLADLTVMGLLQ